jgi:CheY-like chemotaxis protein
MSGTAAPSLPFCVLVVDDHHDGAETLGEFLEVLGCEVHIAHSGVEALDVAPTLQPELVILDIEMPGLSGFETARGLRAQSWAKHSVFATHSGSTQPAIADLSREAGCQHHIPKPATVDTFRRLIDTIREKNG